MGLLRGDPSVLSVVRGGKRGWSVWGGGGVTTRGPPRGSVLPWQEVEALLGETRMLQGKLQSQEDDFRLQNSTLLRELAKVTPIPPPLETPSPKSGGELWGFPHLTGGLLWGSQLCAQIEGLEKENQRLRDGGGPGPPPRDPLGTSGPPQDRGDGDGGDLPAPMEGELEEVLRGRGRFVGWVLGLISFLQPPRSPRRSCRQQRRGGLEVGMPPMGTPRFLPQRYMGW